MDIQIKTEVKCGYNRKHDIIYYVLYVNGTEYKRFKSEKKARLFIQRNIMNF